MLQGHFLTKTKADVCNRPKNPFSIEMVFPVHPKLKKWSQIKYMTITYMLYIISCYILSHDHLLKIRSWPICFSSWYLSLSRITLYACFHVYCLSSPLDVSPMRTGACLVHHSNQSIRGPQLILRKHLLNKWMMEHSHQYGS